MKTIKLKSGKVLRKNNNQARAMVEMGQAEFCPKSEWKKQEKIGPYAPKKEAK
jgi:hypothetical protein